MHEHQTKLYTCVPRIHSSRYVRLKFVLTNFQVHEGWKQAWSPQPRSQGFSLKNVGGVEGFLELFKVEGKNNNNKLTFYGFIWLPQLLCFLFCCAGRNHIVYDFCSHVRAVISARFLRLTQAARWRSWRWIGIGFCAWCSCMTWTISKNYPP